MCWNMAGADATPRVARCIETNPSRCLWSQTLGNPQLSKGIYLLVCNQKVQFEDSLTT